MIDDICKELGYVCKVHSFLDGIELLERVAEFQVAFLDIEMPCIDGIELGKRIKSKKFEM